MGAKTFCPECGARLIHANIGDGTMDIYCEECGWPEEILPPNPSCTVCGEPGVGICGFQWRCEEHWDSEMEQKDDLDAEKS